MAENARGALLLYYSCEEEGPWANSCEGRAQSMSEIRKFSLQIPPTFCNTSDKGWQRVVWGNLRNVSLKVLFAVRHLTLLVFVTFKFYYKVFAETYGTHSSAANP